MDTYYELNEPSERCHSAQALVQHITQMQLDDVRGNIHHALGLLAWSEQSNVMWDAGYLEGFVHCVGMMTQETLKMKEYRNLSQVTRHKLQNANNAMQLRLSRPKNDFRGLTSQRCGTLTESQEATPARRVSKRSETSSTVSTRQNVVDGRLEPRITKATG